MNSHNQIIQRNRDSILTRNISCVKRFEKKYDFNSGIKSSDYYASLNNTNWRKYQKQPLQKQPPEMFCKKGVLRNFSKFTRKHLCQRLFFNKVPIVRHATLLTKEALAQLFSCEFFEISKKTFFYRTPPDDCNYHLDFACTKRSLENHTMKNVAGKQ